MKTGVFCGCGGNTDNIQFDGSKAVHIIESTGCLRKIAVGALIPNNFRPEKGVMVCDVSGYTITEYTLYNQRLYSFESGVWTLPKDESSVNSIEMND